MTTSGAAFSETFLTLVSFSSSNRYFSCFLLSSNPLILAKTTSGGGFGAFGGGLDPPVIGDTFATGGGGGGLNGLLSPLTLTLRVSEAEIFAGRVLLFFLTPAFIESDSEMDSSVSANDLLLCALLW